MRPTPPFGVSHAAIRGTGVVRHAAHAGRSLAAAEVTFRPRTAGGPLFLSTPQNDDMERWLDGCAGEGGESDNEDD